MPVSLLACANTLGFEMCDIVDQQNLTDKTEAPVPPVQTGHDSRQSAGRGSWLRSWLSAWPVIALLALGLAIWQWVETRIRLSDTQVEIARRLSESDTLVNESQILARQAQEQVGVLQGKFGELEGMIAESRSQQATLETLYQDLARNRDEWALAEVEQNVMLAAQQLQLAGNVQGAVLALQTADARLAGRSRSQFISLRKALAREGANE